MLCVGLLMSPVIGYRTLQSSPRCRSLVHIGDSTSAGIVSSLKANYKTFGFTNIYISAGNGRSLAYSTAPDTMNGVEVIRYYKKKLGKGTCWVIALGTNDASSSQKPDDPTRIDSAMKAIDGDPVAWVNVWMNSKTRPNYSLAASKQWNNLLTAKMKNFPNAHIIDWALIVKSKPTWFASDGYHYNSVGGRQRGEIVPLIASLLLQTR